jgi:uncharacterized RDD family membrane protein YckC/DNA-directed RNA polymerase subunit RPC12/RpoP
VNETSASPAQVFCTQCGRPFAVDDLIRFGESYVCADCKSPFLQRVREGAVAGQALHYASFGMRFLAVLLDAVILFVASLAVQFAFGVSAFAGGLGGSATFLSLATLINFGLGFFYYVLLLTSQGATLGKMAMGIKIVTPEGGPISFGRATARYFCANFLEPFTLLIGYLIALFDDQARTLHDRICGTRAITTR